jgi:hypothetical protein
VVSATQTFDRAALAAISALAGGRSLGSHLATLEYADMKPNASVVVALQESCARTSEALTRYRQVVGQDLPTLNAALAAAGLQAVPAPSPAVGGGCTR